MPKVKWADDVDAAETVRQWAAPPSTHRGAHGAAARGVGRSDGRGGAADPPSSPSCAVCGGKPTEGAALPCCARPLCGSCGVPRRCPRCKAPVPTSDAAIAAALERADCASAARRLGVAYARGELGLARDERRAAGGEEDEPEQAERRVLLQVDLADAHALARVHRVEVLRGLLHHRPEQRRLLHAGPAPGALELQEPRDGLRRRLREVLRLSLIHI